jgi:hypothetical protein
MLTNLEICKKIAEIEGKKGHEFMGVFVLSENYNEAVNESHSNSYSFSPCHYEYNPLADDALCFKFCCEDSITINKCSEVVNGKLVWNGDYYARHPKSTAFGSVDKSPNKAVCLEKIEAHKQC